MTTTNIRSNHQLRQRIMKLHEQGLNTTQIECRLPVTKRAIRRVIKQEKSRQEKLAGAPPAP